MCNCNVTVLRSIPTLENELLFINIFISSNSNWHQDKSPTLNFVIQHAMLRKIRRKVGNGALTLGSLYLLCCALWDKADLLIYLFYLIIKLSRGWVASGL